MTLIGEELLKHFENMEDSIISDTFGKKLNWEKRYSRDITSNLNNVW